VGFVSLSLLGFVSSKSLALSALRIRRCCCCGGVEAMVTDKKHVLAETKRLGNELLQSRAYKNNVLLLLSCWQHHAAALHVLLLRQQRSHRSQKRFIACRLSLSPSFVQGIFLLLPRRNPLRICSREVEL
jgi:hypothetical protein